MTTCYCDQPAVAVLVIIEDFTGYEWGRSGGMCRTHYQNALDLWESVRRPGLRVLALPIKENE